MYVNNKEKFCSEKECFIQAVEAQVHINKFGSYRKENATRLHDNDQLDGAA
jgi:hypothetical protein